MAWPVCASGSSEGSGERGGLLTCIASQEAGRIYNMYNAHRKWALFAQVEHQLKWRSWARAGFDLSCRTRLVQHELWPFGPLMKGLNVI